MRIPTWTEPVVTDPAVPSVQEEPVTIGSEPWRLPGTLALPHRETCVAGVVVVHGSGALDRDGRIGAVRPYRDLAHGLAARRIAVLRYEKRTRHFATRFMTIGDFTAQDEVIDDALAAVAFLRADPRVACHPIYIVGHSFGAMLAPAIAAQDGQVAGLVMMAAPSRPLAEHFVEQIEYLSRCTKTVTAATVDWVKCQAAIVLDPDLLARVPPNARRLGYPRAYWAHLNRYDSLHAAATARLPMLFLQAGRDYHVTARDFERWRAALQGRREVCFKTYPRLNHLFVDGEGTSVPDEYELGGCVASVAIDDIAEWMTASQNTHDLSQRAQFPVHRARR